MATSIEAGPENSSGRGFEMNELVTVGRGEQEVREDGWLVVVPVQAEADPETRVMVTKDGKFKHPTLAKLREWNS